MDASMGTVTVSTFIEPYTGIPFLGGEGTLPIGIEPGLVDVYYDEQMATSIVPRPSDISSGLAFSIHLPLENKAKTVRIVHRVNEIRTVLFEGPLESVIRHVCRDSRWKQKARQQFHRVQRIYRALLSKRNFSIQSWNQRFAKLKVAMNTRELKKQFPARSPHDAYIENTTVTPRLRAAMAEEVSTWRTLPTISILVPVFNVEPQWLEKAVDSVRQQIYPHWQLCLADDASTQTATIAFLKSLAGDSRISVTYRKANGHICHATNSAADLATGEFIALLDNDDALAEDALFQVVKAIQDNPSADLIYSDEDKVDAAGHRYDPQFKPDWSPELLLSYNYINHFTVIRRSVFEKVGRFRPGYEGSQDHDLLLRVTEQTSRVVHIPRILYHWRALPSSTASAAGVKTYVHTSGQKAVTEALTRRGLPSEIFVPPFAHKLGLPCLGLERGVGQDRIAVILFGNPEQFETTKTAIDTNTNTAIMTVSGDDAVGLNQIVNSCDADYIVFLEAGTRSVSPNWLSRFIAYAKLPGVGVVGPLLRNPDGSIQSAGVVTGLRDGTAAGDAFAGTTPIPCSYYFYAEVARNVTAVRLNGMFIAKAVFESVGGFDSQTHASEGLCVRLAQKNLRTVYVPGVEFVVGESNPIQSTALLTDAQWRKPDPYHNLNFSEQRGFQPGIDSQLSTPVEASHPPVKAMVVAHNLNSSEGAPRYLSEIVQGLKSRGVLDTTVVSPRDGAGAEVYHSAKIPVQILAARESNRVFDWLEPKDYATFVDRFQAELEAKRPDVIIANTLLTYPAVEAAARAGIPSVWIIHESYSTEVMSRLFRPFVRSRVELAFRLATRVIPASHDTAALFQHLNVRNNMQVIHNGLDSKSLEELMAVKTQAVARKELDVPNGKTVFVAVGTVCERKGQHTLVEAAALLKQLTNQFEVHLVGYRKGEPYGEYVSNLIVRRGLSDHVKLIPETDRAYDYLRAADVFVCTSHMETFSRSIMEALAMGMPIISTPCQGVSEQVIWGANALGFDRGDQQSLYRHMQTLIANTTLRKQMAENARAGFQNHLSLPESLDRYERAILGAARLGPRRHTPWVDVQQPLAATRAA